MKNDKIKKVLLLGSGALKIGEAGEFEHVGHHILHGAEGQSRSCGLAGLAHGEYAAQARGTYVFQALKIDDDASGAGFQQVLTFLIEFGDRGGIHAA